MKILERFEDWIEDKPLLDNTYWFVWRLYHKLIVDSYYIAKYSIQKLVRGYADYEVWDLKTSISHCIYPRLKAFIKLKDSELWSYPSELTPAKWNNILNKILFAIQEDINENKNKPDINDNKALNKYYKNIQEGRELLGKWYGHLWD